MNDWITTFINEMEKDKSKLNIETNKSIYLKCKNIIHLKTTLNKSGISKNSKIKLQNELINTINSLGNEYVSYLLNMFTIISIQAEQNPDECIKILKDIRIG